MTHLTCAHTVMFCVVAGAPDTIGEAASPVFLHGPQAMFAQRGPYSLSALRDRHEEGLKVVHNYMHPTIQAHCRSAYAQILDMNAVRVRRCTMGLGLTGRALIWRTRHRSQVLGTMAHQYLLCRYFPCFRGALCNAAVCVALKCL